MQPDTSAPGFCSDFRIGDRTVRPGLNRIDGPAGPVQVEPKVMEVLVVLAARRGAVVSKDELVQAVWEGRFVSDDVVWRSIRELRRALGDDARGAIETIPKRGYRLVEPAPVPEASAPAAPAPPLPPEPRLVPRRFLGVSLLTGFAIIATLVLLGVRRLETAPPVAPRPALLAASPEAHDAVLRGRYFLSRGLPEDLRRSAGAFRQAIALDAGSAAAWAGLADALHLLVIFGAVPPREGIPPAEEAARKALALDDMLAETHATLGTILFRYHWDWTAAETEMRRAVKLQPGSAAVHHDLAWLLLASRRFDEAVTEIRAAQQLEPLSARANADVGWVYYRARRYGEAVRQMERTLEMEPRFLPARHCLERALVHAGRPAEALRQAREAARQEGLPPETLAEMPADPPDARGALQWLAKRRLEHLIGRGSTAYVSPYALAALHAEAGDQDEALAALQRALEERDPMLVSVDVDPAFDAVRTDPRYQEIVARVGGPGSRRLS
jgi:DNA-binding winged helix-turn-helix (wHTH) protein/tetratricopeptide (TPR) repeat protein